MRLDLASEFPLLAIYALMGLVRRPLAGCESSIRRRLSSGWNARHVVKRRLSSSLSGPKRVQALSIRWHHQLIDVLTIIHAELLVLNLSVWVIRDHGAFRPPSLLRKTLIWFAIRWLIHIILNGHRALELSGLALLGYHFWIKGYARLALAWHLNQGFLREFHRMRIAVSL